VSIRIFFQRSVCLWLVFCLAQGAFAQNPTDDDLPPDPGAISITRAQDLLFGAFSKTGSGGTVTVLNNGSRMATGGIVLLNLGQVYYPAIFEIEAPPGTIISILNGPDATLTGSNGGALTLTLGSCSPASPFTTTVASPGTTSVSIGGTLTVGASNPPGTYSGSFSVIVNYQ
jgi:hypothetical protein